MPFSTDFLSTTNQPNKLRRAVMAARFLLAENPPNTILLQSTLLEFTCKRNRFAIEIMRARVVQIEASRKFSRKMRRASLTL